MDSDGKLAKAKISPAGLVLRVQSQLSTPPCSSLPLSSPIKAPPNLLEEIPVFNSPSPSPSGGRRRSELSLQFAETPSL
ncbi:hypothetical protein TIFTF001_049949 [Ficus carica]|uniref:Uncharacterized protein n=1 Tax=Ficus carica TaxID=3494 RepID=A0AA87YPK2_FICCA|nr:hypothetical protein TIFTF001_049947 [Ficus carica]GMN19774.1 hypothetical protein TIFTF001_049949 [Ficus carica]